MHRKTDDIEIMMGGETIEKQFEFLLQKISRRIRGITERNRICF